VSVAYRSLVVARRQGFYTGEAGFGLRSLPGFPAAGSVVEEGRSPVSKPPLKIYPILPQTLSKQGVLGL